MSSAETKIRVACRSAMTLPLDKIIPFQGDLKNLTVNAYTKLKESILRYGITFPLSVWEDKGKHYDMDGHQRCTVLRKLREEGFTIPEVPVSLIEAKNKKEAREKLLLASSSYADVTEKGLTAYLNDSGINLDEIDDLLKIPDMDNNKFRRDFYQAEALPGDESPEQNDEPEVEGMELMPSEHHDYIVMLFDDYSDFMYMCDKLGVKKVDHSLVKGKARIGIGRCVNGKRIIKEHFSNVK